jgi:Flp pilus assembly protein TadD
LNSRPGEAATERGGLLGSQGRYEEALLAYTEAITVDPTYLEAYNDRGMTYKKLGRYRQALADFDRAIALGATFTVYGRRGATHLAVGQYQQALEDYNRFVKELDLRHLDSMRGSALIGRGRAWVGLGKYQQGIADFTAALRVESRDSYLAQKALYFRGRAWLAQGKGSEALADFDKATAITPTFVDTDLRVTHEADISDLPARRDEARRMTESQVASVATPERDSGARRSGWLGRMLGRR